MTTTAETNPFAPPRDPQSDCATDRSLLLRGVECRYELTPELLRIDAPCGPIELVLRDFVHHAELCGIFDRTWIDLPFRTPKLRFDIPPAARPHLLAWLAPLQRYFLLCALRRLFHPALAMIFALYVVGTCIEHRSPFALMSGMPLVATVFVLSSVAARFIFHRALLLACPGCWIFVAGYWIHRAFENPRDSSISALLLVLLAVAAVVRALSEYHLHRPEYWSGSGPVRR